MATKRYFGTVRERSEEFLKVDALRYLSRHPDGATANMYSVVGGIDCSTADQIFVLLEQEGRATESGGVFHYVKTELREPEKPAIRSGNRRTTGKNLYVMAEIKSSRKKDFERTEMLNFFKTDALQYLSLHTDGVTIDDFASRDDIDHSTARDIFALLRGEGKVEEHDGLFRLAAPDEGSKTGAALIAAEKRHGTPKSSVEARQMEILDYLSRTPDGVTIKEYATMKELSGFNYQRTYYAFRMLLADRKIKKREGKFYRVDNRQDIGNESGVNEPPAKGAERVVDGVLTNDILMRVLGYMNNGRLTTSYELMTRFRLTKDVVSHMRGEGYIMPTSEGYLKASDMGKRKYLELAIKP